MNVLKDLYFKLFNEIGDNYEQIIKENKFFFLKKASFPKPDQNLHRYFNHNTINGQIISYINPSHITNSVWPEIIKLKSARNIFNYIVENHLSPFKELIFEDDIKCQPSITRNLIADFFRRMSELSNFSLDFNILVFDQAFLELENFLLSDTFQYKILISLHGPIGMVDNIQLDNATIKKADYDTSKLFCFYYTDSEMMDYEMFENDYYIEIEQEIVKKNWQEIFLKEKDIIKKVFNCLILSIPGNIELGNSLRVSNAWPLIKTEKTKYNSSQNKYDESNLFRYEFNEKSKLILIENSAKLRLVDYELLDDSIKSSLKRLKNSKSTIDIEDKIIELVLSIEYLINTAHYEVTLQLCLKIIKMYNSSNRDETIYPLLKNFFELRGHVFHGNKKVLPNLSNVELIQKVEEITLNISLKYICLSQHYTFKKINDALHKSLHLDESIEDILNNQTS